MPALVYLDEPELDETGKRKDLKQNKVDLMENRDLDQFHHTSTMEEKQKTTGDSSNLVPTCSADDLEGLLDDSQLLDLYGHFADLEGRDELKDNLRHLHGNQNQEGIAFNKLPNITPGHNIMAPQGMACVAHSTSNMFDHSTTDPTYGMKQGGQTHPPSVCQTLPGSLDRSDLPREGHDISLAAVEYERAVQSEERNDSSQMMSGSSSIQTSPNAEVAHFKECLYLAYKELIVIKTRDPNALPFEDHKTDGEFWKYMMNEFHHTAYATLKFAKKIPGFRKFPVDTQIEMVQTSLYPIVVSIFSTMYDVQHQIYNYFSYTPEEEKLIHRRFPPMIILKKQLHNMGNSIQSLKMDELELSLLCAFFLYKDSSDRKTQECMLATLEHHCSSKSLDGSNRVALILSRLPELQQANVEHQQMVFELARDYPELEMPQLYRELFINT